MELFATTLEVKELDPFGKKFTRVSRIKAVSDVLDIAVLLDVNFDLYPLSVGDKISFVLATKLSQSEGSKDAYKRDKWAPHLDEKTLADDYDYVMYGKVYKYEEHKMHKASVYASFGGLLLCLSGESHQLQCIKTGMNLYLLLK